MDIASPAEALGYWLRDFAPFIVLVVLAVVAVASFLIIKAIRKNKNK